MELMEHVISPEPNNSQHYQMARSLAEKAGDPELALSYYQQGLEMDKFNTSFQVCMKTQLVWRLKCHRNLKLLIKRNCLIPQQDAINRRSAFFVSFNYYKDKTVNTIILFVLIVGSSVSLISMNPWIILFYIKGKKRKVLLPF